MRKLGINITCLLGLVIQVQGQPNHSNSGYTLQFNGTDDHVVISNPNWTNLNEFSAEFWVNMNSYNSNGRSYILDTRGDGAVNNRSFAVFLDSTNSNTDINFYVDWPSGNYTRMEIPILPSKKDWHHIAVTRNGTSMKIYFDGKEYNATNGGSTAPKNDLLDITSTWRVGTYANASTGGNYWTNGWIDEIRIWNKELTQNEIRDHMTQKLTGSEPGLIGYWRFDQGTGSTAFDSSPGGHNGSLQ